ncbi:hypothetical protein BDV30DRAFT_236785 [Aspergillus minisclerotigenes]|uniref:Uncharacterized protein n=1 Tax=Aspergillus minisclerotigenes TaxID=656917 RepID=A0A5N6JAW7_9EURO|nr:hypothetical protein BDV30DRAFT_236785 [Aspergillus minisclerotigenes]
MVLDSKAFQPLDIKLSGPHDDEEDIFFKDLLLSLVGGEISPNEAANNLNKWIVENSNTDLEERKRYPDPWNVPSPENPSWVAPNPSGLITCFFESFARLCSAFPPGHVGQDRLIQFLEALRDMPKHEVPNYLPNDPPEDFYYLLELWPFGGSWLGLTEVFRTEAEDRGYSYATFATPGSDMQIGWRNWQSILARITALRFVDCSFLCALEGILPQSKMPPHSRVSGDVLGGVQWILHPDTGLYVYRQCKAVEKVSTSDSRAMWSLERWGQWKDRLETIASDDTFAPEVREIARLAVDRMGELEVSDGSS